MHHMISQIMDLHFAIFETAGVHLPYQCPLVDCIGRRKNLAASRTLAAAQLTVI